MNNTIDFNTAKTIDTMSKKIDHIDDTVSGFFSFMHMVILKAERRCQYEIRSKGSPISCGSPECISGADAEMDAEPVGVCAGTAHAVYFRLRSLYAVLPGVAAVFDFAGGRVWLLFPGFYGCFDRRGSGAF